MPIRKRHSSAPAHPGVASLTTNPSNKSTSYRLKLERALARACDLLMSQREPDLTKALSMLGRAAGASRAVIWECREGGRIWSNTHEWCARGVRSLMAGRRAVTAAPWSAAKLAAGKIVLVPDATRLPPEASAEKEFRDRWGIRSVIAAPVLSHDRKLLGFVGFSDTFRNRHCRDADDAWALRAFASMVAAYWERKKAEREASLASERFRLLTEQSFDPFAVLDSDGIITYVSPTIIKLLGYAPEELLGRRAADLIHPEDFPRLRSDRLLCEAKPGSFRSTEGRLRHKDGSWRVVEARMVNLVHSEAVRGVAMHLRDITDLRRLQRELVDICTAERENLRRDLHDGLGGYFSALQIRAETLARKVAKGKTVRPEEISDLISLIAQARDTARSISRAVCPVPPRPDGLVRALRQLAADTRKITRRHVRFRCHGPITVSDGPAALQAYRIAQEAVNNAVRHSGATNIVIALEKKDHLIKLSVRDNGRGLQPGPTDHSGMGLSIMQSRAHLLRGSIDIASPPRGGTVVTLSFAPSREKE